MYFTCSFSRFGKFSKVDKAPQILEAFIFIFYFEKGIQRVPSDMGVSKNRGTTKSSILMGVSITNHPFWGTPIFGNTHIYQSFVSNVFVSHP